MSKKKLSKFEAFSDDAAKTNVNGESADTAFDIDNFYESAQIVDFNKNRRGSSKNSIAYINRTMSNASYDSTTRSLFVSSADGAKMELTDVYENRNLAVTFDGYTRHLAKVGNTVSFDSKTKIYYGLDFHSTLKIENYIASSNVIVVDLRDSSYINIRRVNAHETKASVKFHAVESAELIGGMGDFNTFTTSKQLGDVKIVSQKASDKINLYDTRISDIVDVSISSYSSSAETMRLTFNTGKTLEITGEAQNFQLADSGFVYDRPTRTLMQTA